MGKRECKPHVIPDLLLEKAQLSVQKALQCAERQRRRRNHNQRRVQRELVGQESGLYKKGVSLHGARKQRERVGCIDAGIPHVQKQGLAITTTHCTDVDARR